MKKLTLLFTPILTALLLVSPVYAADIRLSPRCTLADAIIAANNDRAEGDCPAGRGADTITLSQDITLRAELPAITSKITIEGEGYTISGDNRYRMFYNEGGALIIHDLTMTKGRVEGNDGGAIFNEGELSIVNSAFSRNSAKQGGAIYNAGELNISGSSFNYNSAEWTGGAIFNVGELSIIISAFSGNSADVTGGAIANGGELSIVSSAFSDNSGGRGGGAIDNWKGTLTISDSIFSGNSADVSGGAIFNYDGMLSGNSGGELTISDSTFSGNSAEYGGAIANGGAFSSFFANGGALNIVSSAFSGNSAVDGGAVYNYEGKLSIVNSTFNRNSADEFGGAIANGEDGELSLINSIIAGDGENACYSDGRLKWNINNFIQDGSCLPAFSGDPMLGELVEPEDGSPAYFPLLAGSRAIDAADDDHCPETDQIGTERPQGAGCDIGAFEYAAES